MIRAISIIGLTGSGKTTVAEGLIRELKKRGFSVGSVKEIHFDAFKMDTEGKNTYRHRQAGASTVTARAHYETDVLYEGRMPIYDLLAHYKEDFIVLEGVRDANVPLISVCKEGETPEINAQTIAISGRFANTVSGYVENIPVINPFTEINRLTDLVLKKTPYLMPDVDVKCCGLCGYDCRGLLAEILNGTKEQKDCVMKSARVSVKIDGKELEIVPFVQTIIENTVTGIVRELKGYNDKSVIEVKINAENA